MNRSGWQDPLIVTLGAATLAAPWLFPTTFGDAARGDIMAWSITLTGVVLTTVALGGILFPGRWEAPLELALGLWLLVSPWATLPFTEAIPSILGATILGGLIVMISGLAAFMSTHPHKHEE